MAFLVFLIFVFQLLFFFFSSFANFSASAAVIWNWCDSVPLAWSVEGTEGSISVEESGQNEHCLLHYHPYLGDPTPDVANATLTSSAPLSQFTIRKAAAVLPDGGRTRCLRGGEWSSQSDPLRQEGGYLMGGRPLVVRPLTRTT